MLNRTTIYRLKDAIFIPLFTTNRIQLYMAFNPNLTQFFSVEFGVKALKVSDTVV